MRLEWKGYCNICSSPLDIRIISTGKRELDLTHTYTTMKPRDWDLNEPWYKFFGLKTKKICMGCKYTCRSIARNPRKLKNRETGTNFPPKYKSITMAELDKWWNDFKTFCRRPDVDQYIIPYLHFSFSGDDSDDYDDDDDFTEFLVDMWGRPEEHTHYLSDY